MQEIKLLQASVDPEEDSYLRILLRCKHIKHLTIGPHVYEADDMCFGPTLITILPHLPNGDWTTGYISRNSISKQPQFTPSYEELPGILNVWHTQSIEYLDLNIGKKLRSNVYEATHPTVHIPIILKFARFSWEIAHLDDETQAYSWVVGQDICPEFLGHVTENGRVIGFVIEHIEDARPANPEDLALCQQSLLKLHKMKIRHGDVNRHNFLIKGGRAILIDLDFAGPCDDSLLLSKEIDSLQTELCDESGKGGRLVVLE